MIWPILVAAAFLYFVARRRTWSVVPNVARTNHDRVWGGDFAGRLDALAREAHAHPGAVTAPSVSLVLEGAGGERAEVVALVDGQIGPRRLAGRVTYAGERPKPWMPAEGERVEFGTDDVLHLEAG